MLNLTIKKSISGEIVIEGQGILLEIIIVDGKIHSLIGKNATDEFGRDYFLWLRETVLSQCIYEVLGYSWKSIYAYIIKNNKSSCENKISFIQQYNERKLPMIFLPLEMLKKGILHYLGKDDFFANDIKMLKDNLICRCFGTEKMEILKFIFNVSSISGVLDITNKFGAGAGCGSCLFDLKYLVDGFDSGQNGHSPVQLILKISELIGESTNRLDGEEILAIKGPIVYFKSFVCERELQRINKIVNKRLNKKLFFIAFSD